MSRRIKILIFDVLSILICIVLFNTVQKSLVIPISIFISLFISFPILYFIIKNKPDNTSKQQKKVFRIFGFIINILTEIPILGFIIVLAPLVVYVVAIVSIHEITESSFFSYFLMSAICIRVIAEIVWKIVISKTTRKIQID